jgi:FixJ family two-component response regulator
MTPARSAMVYVVDDDHAVRQGLETLLRSMGLAVRTFASAQEYLDHEAPDVASCLVLDVMLPGLSGLNLADELARRGRRTPIIFISGQGSIPMSVRAIKSGAVEFLTKPVSDDDLGRAIIEALARDREERLRASELASLEEQVGRLTPREREVMDEVVKGHLNKQIAADLGTVEQTVKVHRGRVMKKLGVDSLADLVRLAERHSLLAGLVRQERSIAPK